MSIPAPLERGKAYLGRIPGDWLLIAILLLSCSAAFGLGILAGRELGQGSGAGIAENGGVWIEDLPAAKAANASGGPAGAAAAVSEPLKTKTEAATVPEAEGTYLASKSGTKYYLPTCGSAKRIKAENRIYFRTRADAEAAGYGPAANCPGL